MRATKDEITWSIRCAALATFRQHGFHGTTLDEIAQQVGLTRGALLHHFGSKAALLAAVVDPFLDALDGVLDDARVDDPPTTAQRRQLMSQLADLVLKYRPEVELVLSDVGTRAQVESVDGSAGRSDRLITLLVGSRAAESDRVRAAAALGALLHPAASPWVNLETAETRAAWLDACFTVVGRQTVTR